jgi:hypothetical protein
MIIILKFLIMFMETLLTKLMEELLEVNNTRIAKMKKTKLKHI